MCKAEVDCLTWVNREYLLVEDLIKLVEKVKEKMEMKKKLEEERNREVKNRVENKKQVVNRKIRKRVRIMMAHMNPMEGKSKVELEKAVVVISKLLDGLVWTNRILRWKVRVTVEIGDQNDNLRWEVSRVPKHTLESVVARVLGRQLVVVIKKTEDLMNERREEETFKMVASDALMVKPLGRKVIGQKLREENQKIKNIKRYTKYRGQAKVIGFIFDVVRAAEAVRLITNGIKWEGKIRRVSVLRKGESGKQMKSCLAKVLAQKKKEEVKQGRQQPRKALFSFVICDNCIGKGHSMKTCT